MDGERDMTTDEMIKHGHDQQKKLQNLLDECGKQILKQCRIIAGLKKENEERRQAADIYRQEIEILQIASNHYPRMKNKHKVEIESYREIITELKQAVRELAQELQGISNLYGQRIGILSEHPTVKRVMQEGKG